MAAIEKQIHLAISGDREALAALLERFGPVIRRKLTSKIDPRWQSLLSEDDVMQETYADAFLSIHQFQPQGERSFEKWLTTLAQNNLRDAVKGLRAAKRGGAVPVMSQSVGDSEVRLLEQLGVTTTSPSEPASLKELKELLNELVEELPDSYRQVVRKYDLEEAPVNDVAQSLGCSPGAVYMRRARAHALLRELWGSRSQF